MKKLSGFLIVSCLSVSLCAAAGSPDWLKGKSKAYPDKDFIIGVGEGGSVSSAGDAARAEIGKVFETKVEQVSNEIQKESSMKSGVVSEQSSELETRAYTSQLLEGVAIADTWENKKKNRYYALAVLDKKKTAADLSFRMLEQEEIMKSQLSAADKTPDVIEKIKLINSALSSLDAKSALEKRSRVVSQSAMPDMTQGMTRADLLKRRDDEMAKVSFVIQDESEQGYGLKTVLAEYITKLGFKVAEQAEDKNSIVIKCRLELAPVDRGAPRTRFFGWKVSAEFFQSGQQSIMASAVPQGQVSAATDDAAKDKALLVAKQSIGAVIDKTIKEKVLGVK